MGISWEDRPGIQREHRYIYIYKCVSVEVNLYTYTTQNMTHLTEIQIVLSTLGLFNSCILGSKD